jgi:hypothetical protein
MDGKGEGFYGQFGPQGHVTGRVPRGTGLVALPGDDLLDEVFVDTGLLYRPFQGNDTQLNRVETRQGPHKIPDGRSRAAHNDDISHISCSFLEKELVLFLVFHQRIVSIYKYRTRQPIGVLVLNSRKNSWLEKPGARDTLQKIHK